MKRAFGSAFDDFAFQSAKRCQQQPMDPNQQFFSQAGFPSPTGVLPQYFTQGQGHVPAFQGSDNMAVDESMDGPDGYPSDDEGDHYRKTHEWWASWQQQVATGAIVPEMEFSHDEMHGH